MYLQHALSVQGVQARQHLLFDQWSPLVQVHPDLRGYQVVHRVQDDRYDHPYQVILSLPTTDKEQECGECYLVYRARPSSMLAYRRV